MTGEPTRFSRWGNRISWLLVPLAAVMQFVWLRRPVNIAGVTMTLELPLFGFLALIAAPWAVARIRVMNRWVQVLAGVFTVLIVYAMVGIAWRASPVVETSHLTVVPGSYLLVPLLTALLAMAAGLGLAMAADRRHLPVVLTWAAGALVAAGFVAWPRQVPAHRSLRLATALGGSASIHLVFLLAAAVGLGWYLRSRGTVRSVEGAAGPAWSGLVLVVLGVTGVLATGSRGGLLALARLCGVLPLLLPALVCVVVGLTGMPLPLARPRIVTRIVGEHRPLSPVALLRLRMLTGVMRIAVLSEILHGLEYPIS